MKRLLLAGIAAFALSACSTPEYPDGYIPSSEHASAHSDASSPLFTGRWAQKVAISSDNLDTQGVMGRLLRGNMGITSIPAAKHPAVIVRVLFHQGQRRAEYNVQFNGHLVAQRFVTTPFGECDDTSSLRLLQSAWFAETKVQDRFLDFVFDTFKTKLPSS